MKARIVVVCAATVESARLLLNSVSPQHPAGLGNSSGVVGHYLHGHVTASAQALPEGVGRHKAQSTRMAPPITSTFPGSIIATPHRGYAGGYGIQVNYDSYMFPPGAYWLKGYGAEFKRRVRTMQPGYVILGCFGKSIAAKENYVSVDKNRVDAHGIPIPVIHFQFVENDARLWQGMRKGLQQIASKLSAGCLSR